MSVEAWYQTVVFYAEYDDTGKVRRIVALDLESFKTGFTPKGSPYRGDGICHTIAVWTFDLDWYVKITPEQAEAFCRGEDVDLPLPPALGGES